MRIRRLGLVDHRQSLEAEEVEFHQPGFFGIFHVVLRGGKAGARIAVQRHQLFQRPVANHNASGMGGGVAIEAFEFQCDVEQRFHSGVAVTLFLQARFGVNGLCQASPG